MKKLFSKIRTSAYAFCSEKHKTPRRLVFVAFELLSLIGVLLLLGAPFCIAPVYSSAGELVDHVLTPFSLFKNIKLGNSSLLSFAYLQVGLLVFITIFAMIIIHKIIRSLFSLSKDEEDITANAKKAIILGATSVLVYTVFAYLFTPINKATGGYSVSAVSTAPLIYVAIVCLLYSIYAGIVASAKRMTEDESAAFRRKAEAERKKILSKLFGHQLELILFALGSAAIAIYSMLVDIVKVTFDVPGVDIPDFIISGKTLLFESSTLETTNERSLSFTLFVLFALTLVFAFISLVSFFSRSALCSKFALTSIVISSVSCGLVGLFGIYYQTVQKLNEEIVLTILDEFSIVAESLLVYTAESTAFLYFAILITLVVVCFVRHPYSKAMKIEKKLYSSELSVLAPEVNIINDTKKSEAAEIGEESTPDAVDAFASVKESSDTEYSDPCPAFTEIDSKLPVFKASLEEKRQAIFEEPSLPRLVDFIVQYARDSRLHLFYTPESIAAFLAGLGSTRLTILQGMSGTGKTSLPKIVAEALCSVCDIVEVESSWRDKNELLGYYNEFNKVYTPKKFTQALYRANLNSDTLTFIVLDEMNLSRIEYYFSDFLSLMENEPDRRELKLLNVSLARTVDGKRRKYAGLTDGHTLKIPQNVWFIGTANRDESTYDISDKVYDRAHTINFDKRAPKPSYYSEPIEAKYLPAAALIDMFENAKEGVKFDIDAYPLVAKVEKLLAPYNISFGNRIAMQIESFVKIYASCFAVTDAVIHQALETILLSKVVKKLELKSIENKEELAAEFEKLQLSKCAKFIAELSED